MKTDKELLELAAKAVGYGCFEGHAKQMIESGWNPLTDDGDAFRLAVKLGMQVAVDIDDGEVRVAHDLLYSILIEPLEGVDIYAATRRAIVRVAAAIGEAK